MSAPARAASPSLRNDLRSRVAITVAPDGRHAIASAKVAAEAYPCHGGDPSAIAQALSEIAAEHGVVHGLQPEALLGFAGRLVDPNFTESAEIASATQAEHGRNGTFVPAFDVQLAPGRVSSLDRANFFERGLLQKARANDIIGRRTPPEVGRPGRSVTGQEIPAANGIELEMSCGPGVRLVEGRDYLALLDGAISWVPGRSLDVCDVYDHHGDVDLKSGNLDMEGSIVITGAIQPQLTVTASRDVMVGGNVEGARIRCGGNLTVLGSVFGGEQGASVSVEGDAVMRSAIRSRLAVSGQLTVDREIALCRVTVGSLVMTGGRSRIVGGTVRARDRIEVQDVGAPTGTPTEIRIGWDAHGRAKLLRRMRQLEFQAGDAGARGREQSRGKTRRSREVADRIAAQEKIRFQRAEEELLDRALILVRGTIYAGATLVFGRRAILVEENIRAAVVKFNRQTGAMVIEGKSL